jgi:hypothetical protein
MATKMTADQRFEQIEADLRKLARVTMKSAGGHPDLVEILARYTPEGGQERRPHEASERRAA